MEFTLEDIANAKNIMDELEFNYEAREVVLGILYGLLAMKDYELMHVVFENLSERYFRKMNIYQ